MTVIPTPESSITVITSATKSTNFDRRRELQPRVPTAPLKEITLKTQRRWVPPATNGRDVPYELRAMLQTRNVQLHPAFCEFEGVYRSLGR